MRTGDQIVQNLPWRWNVQGKIFLIGGLGYLFDTWGLVNTFLILMVAVFVAIGMMIKFGPETKGMELDAVVEDGDAAPMASPTPVLD